jgi:hypothetical protein
MASISDLNAMEERIRTLENRFNEAGYSFKKIVTSEIKQKFRVQPQAETHFGMFTALCVDTIDPWKQNRVRYFSPLFHNPDETPIKALPFAHPISTFGGFDDSGSSWVPPAGSTLCIVFENGSRQAPFYIGTTWHRDRGPAGQHNWGFNIEEYYKIHEGHRKGYLLGPDDGSQVLPPWNTESYNGVDLDSNVDFVSTPEAQKKLTYPNIYGFKTPQKHMLKMVDGDYKCNHKNKRIELLSGCGNWLLFKDDHLHEFNPQGEDQDCADSAECKEGKGPGNTPSNSPYFKHRNELRPWKGAGTPQGNKCDLKQSGVQIMSLAGHTVIMDDSVSEPSGFAEWERSIKPFDFGCDDRFTGHMFFVSATGHRFEMNDEEENTRTRGEKNYIRMLSACGNRIELNDHSKGEDVSGSQRGIHMESTSHHTFDMTDGEDLEQASPRKEGGIPTPKAKKAFIRIRSGYGLEFLMSDTSSQEETQRQSIQIFSPQRDNTDRGPHILRFQEAPSGPGQVFLKVGGNYVCLTYDSHMTVVGDQEKNPADKITFVTKNTLIDTKEFYLNVADVHLFLAKQVILLLAGEDCPNPETGTMGACAAPVLCMTSKGVVMSDRVFASASNDAPCVSVFHLTPFHQCKTS